MRRSVKHSPATAIGAPSVADELVTLPSLSIDEVRARFRRLYRRAAPEAFSRDLIARLVAHRLQEVRLGKLDPELSRQLGRLCHGKLARRRIKTGSVLVREYDGIAHEVVITPGGFLWKGETHPSLSLIAKRITGTNWNGPRFFGLRPVRTPAPGAMATAGAA